MMGVLKVYIFIVQQKQKHVLKQLTLIHKNVFYTLSISFMAVLQGTKDYTLGLSDLALW